MTFRSIILGGAAAVALTCSGFVASSSAQTQPADQSAPAASSTPATQAAPAEKPAADDSSAATTTKHVKHHRRMHSARNGSTKQERAETQKLNQDQLAKVQGASQGQYGTMEQQRQPGAEPGNMNNAPAPSTSNSTGGPNTAAPSNTAQPSDNGKTTAPNTNPPPSNTPQPPNPSSPPQKP